MTLRERLFDGMVIPAHPLALTAERRLDERRQTGLTRYYVDAGAGGLAVGVHTTQFAIRDHGLLEPVLRLAHEAARTWSSPRRAPLMIAGVVGATRQALAEAELAHTLGYDAVLLSLAALGSARDDELLVHCRAVAEIMPVVGFYLQPAIGGRVLGYGFWRAFAEIPNVVAIKIAPFNRYQTLDVVRAIAEAGRDDIALYTGNDDSILVDLLTPFEIGVAPAQSSTRSREPSGRRRIVGGLLGQWAVWTQRAVTMLDEIRVARAQGHLDASWLTRAAALTDANGVIFDAANGFRGCIPGIHDVLRRQGLLAGTWCLDPHEQLSPGQAHELDRVCAAYPFLTDDAFVAEHLDRGLA